MAGLARRPLPEADIAGSPPAMPAAGTLPADIVIPAAHGKVAAKRTFLAADSELRTYALGRSGYPIGSLDTPLPREVASRLGVTGITSGHPPTILDALSHHFEMPSATRRGERVYVMTAAHAARSLASAAQKLDEAYRRADPGQCDFPRIGFPRSEDVHSHLSSRHPDHRTYMADFIAQVAYGDERFEPLRRSIPQPTAAAPRLPSKVRKAIEKSLISLVPRDAATMTLDGVHIEQRFGHSIEEGGGHHFVERFTLGSDKIKDASTPDCRQRLAQFNANLGVVVAQSPAGARHLVCTRSARVDSPHRVEEMQIVAAQEALRAVPPTPIADAPHRRTTASAASAEAAPGHVTVRLGNGLSRQGGRLAHRVAIASALDLSPVKDLAMWVTRGEQECPMVKAQRAAVQAIPEAGVEKVLRFGAEHRAVALLRPLLLSLPMSGQAKNPANIARSRAYNREAAEELFAALGTIWGGSATSSESARGLAVAMQGARTPGATKRFLRTLSRPGALDGLSARETLALSALKLILTGSDVHGDTHLRPEDPARELILMHYLLQEANVSIHVHCKSGQDRTLSMVAVLAMVSAYEATHAGAVLDPRWLCVAEREADHVRFAGLKRLFSDAANTFGEGPIRLRHGQQVKWGLKVTGDAGHPVPRVLFDLAENRLGLPLGARRGAAAAAEGAAVAVEEAVPEGGAAAVAGAAVVLDGAAAAD